MNEPLHAPSATADSAQEPTVSDRAKDIRNILRQFTQEIDSLAETLPLATTVIQRARKNVSDELSAFLELHKIKRDGGKKITFIVPAGEALTVEKLARKRARSAAALALVPRSFLVALVSQYDAYLGRLIQALLLLRPGILNGSERSLSFSDLIAFGTIEAAQEHIIDKEVESVLRKSHAEQFDWLENKFDIKLRHDLKSWPLFVELTERRNLCVHTGAKVSAQYLQNCLAHKVDLNGVALGQVLPVSRKYFTKAYETIFEIGVKLGHVFWRKLKPDDREIADASLNNLAYELLAEQKYGLAINLLDFATDTLKKHASAEARMTLVINRIQAYKWSGDEETAGKLLEKEDFSALNDQFKLAAAVLADDDSEAYRLMRKIGKDGAIPLGHYREWPLFRALRNKPGFDDVVFEVFGEKLAKEVVASAFAGDGDTAQRDGEDNVRVESTPSTADDPSQSKIDSMPSEGL